MWSCVVRRPSVVIKFHIFNFSSETAEWNLTTLYRQLDLNVLYQVCVFSGWSEKQDDCMTSDWLNHFQLLWNCWIEFNETWQKQARSQCPLPGLCFSSRSENKMAALASDWLRHFQLLLWNRWTEFNETWQEERSQCPLQSLCFWADQKNKMAALANPLKRWHIVLRCTICGPLGLFFWIFFSYPSYKFFKIDWTLI